MNEISLLVLSFSLSLILLRWKIIIVWKWGFIIKFVKIDFEPRHCVCTTMKMKFIRTTVYWRCHWYFVIILPLWLSTRWWQWDWWYRIQDEQSENYPPMSCLKTKEYWKYFIFWLKSPHLCEIFYTLRYPQLTTICDGQRMLWNKRECYKLMD